MHEPILRKLRAFRGQILRAASIEGAARVVLVVAGLVLLSLALDYHRRLAFSSRLFALVVGWGVVALVVWRWLLSRLTRPMDVERVALTVEDRFPELRDRVISSLQFAEWLRAGGAGRSEQSTVMMKAVTADAVRAVEPLDLGRTLDRGRVLRAGAAALAACLVIVGMTRIEVQKRNLMWIWFQRNVLLREVGWPQRTHLSVEYKNVIPRGDALTVTVTAKGELPSTVTIYYRYRPSRRSGEEDLAPLAGGARGQFRARFKNVVEPLEFYVSGGDAVTDTYRVDLVERPNIVQLKFWAVYPHYTRLEPKLLTASESFIEVLPGTKVRVAAVPSKPLSAASLTVNEEETGVKMGRAADEETWNFWFTKDERTAMEERAKAGKGVAECWTGDLKVTDDCSVAVNVVDTVSLNNQPPSRFTVKLIADKEPMVTIKMKGIGEMVVPKAIIPLEIRATDDFGVKGLSLVHKFMVEDRSQDEETIPFTQVVFGGKQVSHEMRWNLEPLGLQPGQVLVFRAEATDYKDTPPKNVGRSDTVSLRVVTPDELLADLVRRQIEQRQDFARIRDRQTGEIDIEIGAAARDVRAKGTLTEDQKKGLLTLEQTLRNTSEELKHVGNMFEQIYLEMTNNRVGEPDELNRLRGGVVEPTRRIAESMVPQLADAVRPTPEMSGEALKKQVASLVDLDARILKEMDQVFANMIQLETFRAMVDLARKIREDQSKLLEDIEKERKRLLELILGPTP